MESSSFPVLLPMHLLVAAEGWRGAAAAKPAASLRRLKEDQSAEPTTSGPAGVERAA
jgi:hypothetical protein